MIVFLPQWLVSATSPNQHYSLITIHYSLSKIHFEIQIDFGMSSSRRLDGIVAEKKRNSTGKLENTCQGKHLHFVQFADNFNCGIAFVIKKDVFPYRLKSSPPVC